MKDKSLQSFNKTSFRRIEWNDFLNKIRVSPKTLGTFCTGHVETLEHVFFGNVGSHSYILENVTKRMVNKELNKSPNLHISVLTCLGLKPSSTILISHAFLNIQVELRCHT